MERQIFCPFGQFDFRGRTESWRRSPRAGMDDHTREGFVPGSDQSIVGAGIVDYRQGFLTEMPITYFYDMRIRQNLSNLPVELSFT